MAKGTHRLEQRAQMLTARLGERVTAFTNVLAPPGQRPPFSTALPKAEALAWWTKNRHTDFGAQVLSRWSPEQIAELDATLAQHLQAQAEQGQPIATSLSGMQPDAA